MLASFSITKIAEYEKEPYSILTSTPSEPRNKFNVDASSIRKTAVVPDSRSLKKSEYGAMELVGPAGDEGCMMAMRLPELGLDGPHIFDFVNVN